MSIPENIKQKILKLLALANDKANEFESEAAASAAQALMIKYNLTQDAIINSNKHNEYKEVFDRHEVLKMGKIPDWKLLLCGQIGKLNNVFVMKQRNKRDGTTCIIMIGRKEDVEIVLCLYHYVSNQIEYHVGFHKGKGASYLKSFRVGMSSRIYDRMKEAKEKAQNDFVSENNVNPQALIVAKNTLQYNIERIDRIRKFLNDNGTSVKNFTIFTKSADAYNEGIKAGNKVIITAPNKQLGV